MFRTAHTLGGILVLSVAAVLVTPGHSHARGGGGHYRGAHVGGYHGAVHFGGYHAGAYHSGYHYGDGRYYGGYRYPYAHYGYRPYYGSYGYYPYLYNTYPSYDYGAAPVSYGNATYGTQSSDAYQAFYPPPTVIPSDTSAHVTVTVPEGGEIWFDGTATSSTGTVRQFNSPPLTSGNHSYEIRARWNEHGREVTQSQRVVVTPGAHVTASFPAPSKTAELASPIKK
jgi:uncharacterized protein (TIGR03000 family)